MAGSIPTIICVDVFYTRLNNSHNTEKPDKLCDIICALSALLWCSCYIIVRVRDSIFVSGII